MLSIKGREPFIRMHLWLNDPQNVEKLQSIKEERDSLKRKRSLEPREDSSPGSPTATELSDPYCAIVGSPGSGAAKKQRLQFTDRQREALKVAFALDPYPSPSAIDFLGQELGLEPRAVINWFHNHRMRLKQQEVELSPAEKEEKAGTAAFDPLHFRLLVNQRLLGLGGGGEGRPDSPPTDEAAARPDEQEDSNQSMEQGQAVSGSVPGGGRSRRKPLAPQQWVNADAGGAEDDEEALNGSAGAADGDEKEAAAESDGKEERAECAQDD